MAPRCFDACPISSCTHHLEGTWVEREHPLYHISFAKIERALGVRGDRGSSNYGRCDEKRALGSAPGGDKPRPTYRWNPSTCQLKEYTPEGGCGLLRGKSVMVVGDSTAGQLWYSLAIQLRAVFGRNARFVSVLDEAVASACNDTVRLVFSRNDLLILNPRDFGFFSRVDPAVKLHAFSERASRDADVLLLSVGHHFPSFVGYLSDRYGAQMPPNAFFHLNLNHTLAEIIHRRRTWGHLPSSTVLISSVIPVPGCRRFTTPLQLADALYAQSAAVAPEFQGLRLFWDSVLKQNTIAQWLAATHGAAYLDISPLSLMRPDGQMARFSPKNDCLHSCMPGPVDTWIQLTLNLWEGLTDRWAAVAAPSHGGRLFALDFAVWTKQRGTAYALELCNARASERSCWAIQKRRESFARAHYWLFVRRSKNGSAV
ncbi:hypothetical protein AB1Y20_015063 [Prymnesium parvum]|uniref:Trichome birefringence-like C-terminal domain-containing protein n=1 Tax=Prymnesium parvum TaxID=97485 RepID=A0AB34JVM7_PRYPA